VVIGWIFPWVLNLPKMDERCAVISPYTCKKRQWGEGKIRVGKREIALHRGGSLISSVG
jgi:hypothetical protein